MLAKVQQTNVGLSFAGEVQLVLYRNLDSNIWKNAKLQQMIDDLLFKSESLTITSKQNFSLVYLSRYKYQLISVLDRCGASVS